MQGAWQGHLCDGAVVVDPWDDKPKLIAAYDHAAELARDSVPARAQAQARTHARTHDTVSAVVWCSGVAAAG